jgi:hypothetical protein
MDSSVLFTSKTIHDILWQGFGKEYYTKNLKYGCNTSISWSEFINGKNLGVIAKISEEDISWVYNIINEKQWLFSKIKYGI